METITKLARQLQENRGVNKAMRFTQALIIGLTLFLVFFDMVLYSKEKITISRYINELSYGGWYVFSWVWGVLAAHMFFTRKSRAIEKEWMAIVILLILSILIYLSHFLFEISHYRVTHLVFLVLGAVAGYFIWPQTFDKEKEYPPDEVT